MSLNEESAVLGRLAGAVERLEESEKETRATLQVLNSTLIRMETVPNRIDAAEDNIKDLQRWRWKLAGGGAAVASLFGYLNFFKH